MARKLKGQQQTLSGSPSGTFTNFAPKPIQANRAPTTADTGYEIGQLWADSNGTIIYGLSDVSAGVATWNLLGPGASDVDTLTGDSGGAISPTAGTIVIAGGTNITTVGTAGPGTITFNLDAAITLATSVTSPLYTSSAADVLLQPGGANDVVARLGDAAGATFFRVQDSTSADVFTVDSLGAIALTNLSNTGTFTTAGGTASINASSNFNTVINSGTSTGTVTIGNAAAGAITIDTAAGISLDAATASNFTVTGAADLTVASTLGGVDISSGEAATSTGITLTASAADGGMTFDAGTGGILIGISADCTPISIGDVVPTTARTITIGGGAVATAIADTIDIGPDGANTDAGASKVVTINNGGVTLGTLTTNIASGAITSGTHTVSIQTGNAAAGTVATNISTGTGTKTVSLGNADANTTFNVDAITLINDSVNANTSINTGTSTGAIAVGNAAAGAVTVDTAAGISLDAATASNLTVSAGALDIDCSGQLQINSSASTIDIGNDAVSQNMNIGTAGARTITIGNNTGATSVVVDTGTGAASFGATATAHTTTIGSTVGASDTIIQAGTGEITVTGTVKEISAEFLSASGSYIPAITQSPILQAIADTGAAPVGTINVANLMMLQNGVSMESYNVTAQTIIAPRMDANGLNIALDQANGEGVEYNFGADRSNGGHTFTIGTDAAFFFEVGLYINDMDGAAPYVIGFRKVEANNATFGNYTDYATIGMNAATSTTFIVTLTELNSTGQTSTISTDLWGGDGATNTLGVLVDASGNVTYTLNGAALNGAVAFQFDNGDEVAPFIRIGHSASATDVAITSLKVGYQA